MLDGFDPTWDKVFLERSWGDYPPEALVRFIARSFPTREDTHPEVLEIGCGTGANLWYLAREHCRAFGVDASQAAIDLCHKRSWTEWLKYGLAQLDVKNIGVVFSPSSFDAVVDICCLNHAAINADPIVSDCHTLLKVGGKMLSMLLAEGTYGADSGTEIAPRTYINIQDGPLAGVGRTKVYTRADVDEAFACFRDVAVQRMTVTDTKTNAAIIHWIVTATKDRSYAH